MSLNTPLLPSRSDEPLACPRQAPGRPGAFWMLTIGAAKSLNAALQSVTPASGRDHRRDRRRLVGVREPVPVLQALGFDLLAGVAGALHGFGEHALGRDADAIRLDRRQRLIVIEQRDGFWCVSSSATSGD